MGYDPWNAEETAHILSREGFEMVEARQGYRSMSEPSKTFEPLVIEHKVSHGGNSVMGWMIPSLMWMSGPKGNRYPKKENDMSKIDGPAAAIIARALVTDSVKEFDPLKGLNFA